jgi:GNAT superfamily N-acetyltransferase
MTTLRRAEPKDCEEVFYLTRAFATSFAVERSAFEVSFSALLESPDALLAVAVEEERVVGYVLGFDHYALFANGRVAWVEEIMVAEGVRRRNIGRRLMETVEYWARDRQSRLIGVATRWANAFYRSLGYDESATYFRRLL